MNISTKKSTIGVNLFTTNRKRLIIPFLLYALSFQSNAHSHYFTKKICSKLNCTYSVNVETLALIFNLSDSGQEQFKLNPHPRSTLARELTLKFIDFQHHEAVQLVNKLVNEDDLIDSYDILLGLYFTDLPNFNQFSEYPSIYYENDIMSKTELMVIFKSFNDAVRKFYIDANLEEFFKTESNGLYPKLMQEVNAVKPSKKYISILEDYFGIKRYDYNIIVSAFSFNGIGRSKFITNKNHTSMYQFVTSNPSLESDEIDLENLNEFNFGYNDPKYFREVATHELCHSFLHETLREDTSIIKRIGEYSYLYQDNLKIAMESIGYQGWNMCFEEHLVRYTEIMVALKLGEHEFAKNYKKDCVEKGFIYLDQFAKIMPNYETGDFLTIADFIPKLLIELDKLIKANKKDEY